MPSSKRQKIFLKCFLFFFFLYFMSEVVNVDGEGSQISLLPDENTPLGQSNEIKYSYVFNGLDMQLKSSIALR